MTAKQRYFAYDFIRAVAIIMVVAVHALGEPGLSNAARWYDSIMRSILFLSNVLFFMLSGKLNLRVRSDSELPDYYYRKFSRILLPTLVYILLQSTYEQIRYQGAKLGQGLILRAFIINSLGDYSGGVHWFIMALFGMLLAAPILAPAVDNITPGRRKAFVVLFLLFVAPHILLCRTSHTFTWKYELTSFFGIFLYGAILDLDRATSIPKWKVALPTLFCILTSASLLFLGFPHHPVNDNTPMYFISGVGFFVLLYGWSKEMKPSPAVSYIAKHSFGIYLCHIPLLLLIQPFFSIVPMPFRHLLVTAVTLLVVLFFVSLVDSVLVGPLQKITDGIWAKHTNGAR